MIDAHAHAFELLSGFGSEGEFRAIGNGEGVWATGRKQKVVPDGHGDTSFTVEELLRLVEPCGVKKVVLMQGGFLGFANEYVASCMRRYPEQIRGAGTFDPFCRQSRDILTYLLEGLKFRIFKFEVSSGCGIMGSHQDFPLDSKMMMEHYERIAGAKGMLVFDIGGPGDGAHQPEAIGNIASAFPAMPIVVCHLGSYKRDQRSCFDKEMHIMKRENIFFDLAALFWKVRPEEFPYQTVQYYIKEAGRMVGPERLMWGSDAPSTVCKLSYDKQIEYVAQCFSSTEQELVFYRTADELYFSS